MTVLAPEIPARGEMRAGAAAPAAGRHLSAENITSVLLQLRCLHEAGSGINNLSEAFENSVAEELQGGLNFSEIWSRRGLWLGYSSFAEEILRGTGEDQRNLQYGRYVLSQIAIDDLFGDRANWQSISQSVQNAALKRISDADFEAQLHQMLPVAYSRQRAKALKQLALRTLPTLVLSVSTLIAVVMAFFVWRSLFI